MNSYLALLRGVNVGGKNMIKMADLKLKLESSDLTDVRTYIQSGNVLFTSAETNVDKLAKLVKASIEKHFKISVDVVVFSKAEWQKIVDAAPKTWGKDPEWRHNLMVMLRPYDMKETMVAMGELKPDIEQVDAGEGVLYQSTSIEMRGRTTSGKIVSNPLYKKMTIRNYTTATKLLTMM